MDRFLGNQAKFAARLRASVTSTVTSNEQRSLGPINGRASGTVFSPKNGGSLLAGKPVGH
jgi:hypothetical protein